MVIYIDFQFCEAHGKGTHTFLFLLVGEGNQLKQKFHLVGNFPKTQQYPPWHVSSHLEDFLMKLVPLIFAKIENRQHMYNTPPWLSFRNHPRENLHLPFLVNSTPYIPVTHLHLKPESLLVLYHCKQPLVLKNHCYIIESVWS